MSLPVPSGFLNPAALAAALLVIPLILLYLLKPKPRKIRFPTVMFIKRIEESKRFSALFNKFIKDPLLLLQILVVVLLAAAMANPYALVQRTTAPDEAMAIVIDASASMQATDVQPTRFLSAVQKARELILKASDDSTVSIILAENIPVTIMSNARREKALEVLDRINCADTPSNTPDALILAKDMLSESALPKTVYLISDFAKTEGDVLTSAKILKLNGISVQFIKLNNDVSNAGIIDSDARRTPLNRNLLYLSYTLRNYGDAEEDVTSKVYVDNMLASEESHAIKPLSEEAFQLNVSITSERHLITVEVLDGGMLNVDDKAYAVVPQILTHRTMLLTSGDRTTPVDSGGRDKFVAYAIGAQSNNALRIAEPPVIPSLGEFDTIVIGDVQGNTILPGTFRDIKNFVAEGNALIIIASPDILNISDKNFEDLMPVALTDLIAGEKNIKTTSHEMLADVSLENVVVKKYYRAAAKENATVIAETEGNPLIAYRTYGNGKVIYIGVNPAKDWSNFQYSSSYPIFWAQAIEYANQKYALVKSISQKTGEYLVLEKDAEVTNPSGAKATARSVFLDKTGFYTIHGSDGDETIAVNLENADESDIKTAVYDENSMQALEVTEEKSREELFRVLLAITAVALLIEIVVYRRRGLL